MDKLTVISGCLFLAADIFAIASIANPDWISTGDSAGTLLVQLYLLSLRRAEERKRGELVPAGCACAHGSTQHGLDVCINQPHMGF